MKPINNYDLNLIPDENKFGYKRKYDYHTGVDLFCDENTEYQAVGRGKVPDTVRGTRCSSG